MIERTCLYRMYDAVGALLYVGITNRPDLRFAQHAADKPWWREVVTIKKQWFDTRVQAERAEIIAIKRERPRYNIEHNMSNPHRVRYTKLNAPAGAARRPARRRTRRGRIKRMDIKGWAWLVTIAVLMALTAGVGVWAGILGLVGVFGARVGWERYGKPMVRDTRDSFRTLTQRK